MVEFDSAEKLRTVTQTNVITGNSDYSKHLYWQLIESINKATSVDIVVSFLMESGVKMLLKHFRKAVERGVRIRILTGNYLGITQPSALYLLKKEFGDSIELRFYNEKEHSFHPKSYIIHYDDYSDIYIGSSNISRSALTSGIEWNYRFSSIKDPASYNEYYRTFIDLFDNHAIIIDDQELKRYSQSWHKPAAINDLERYDDSEKDINILPLYEPRGAQIEALCSLQNTRAEGATKALIVAATGIGKTYLAAFDSANYSRVLFIAHREEILHQAAISFKNVRNSDDFGFFNGQTKCEGKPVVFASVSTLGRLEYLNPNYFAKDYFQYIVIDEFHHAVGKYYKNILDYFTPEFLLGLTATPDRMDGKSIYELCGYNVPYEIGLKEGINKGLLVPFHYYGIYDEVDYSQLRVVNGHYDERELTEIYRGNVNRHDLIYKHYCKYGSNQALGFCCSRKHAEEMAAEFSKRGIPSVAVYSDSDGEHSEDRAVAIQRMKKGEIRVIFSVDMFNEGVDISSIDMVMFLRPTESPIVFLQQLGRGLRTYHDKKYLNVLDFIGNYEKAGRIRFLLTDRSDKGTGFQYSNRNDYPDNCIIDFDMKLIDLFTEMDKRHQKIREIICSEYNRVKGILNHRPSRVELFTYMDDDVYQLAITHNKENVFKFYLEFLKSVGDLSEEENQLYNSIGRELLSIIETTNMTKVYKMPVLLAFCDTDRIKMRVTRDELLASWKSFFDANGNWKDIDKNLTFEQYKSISDSEHIKRIISMPVHFLQESGKGFFVSDSEYPLCLRDDFANIVSQQVFATHFKDAVEYRALDYYQRRYRTSKSDIHT